MGSMASYSKAAVERAMKVQEVILRALAGCPTLSARVGVPNEARLVGVTGRRAGWFLPAELPLRTSERVCFGFLNVMRARARAPAGAPYLPSVGRCGRNLAFRFSECHEEVPLIRSAREPEPLQVPHICLPLADVGGILRSGFLNVMGRFHSSVQPESPSPCRCPISAFRWQMWEESYVPVF